MVLQKNVRQNCLVKTATQSCLLKIVRVDFLIKLKLPYRKLSDKKRNANLT